MTAKIFRNSFFVGLLVLLAAGILFLSVMYANDETLAFDELETEMAVLAPAVERLCLPYLQELDAAGRVTWIAADGSVLYDNSARKDNMENHLAREDPNHVDTSRAPCIESSPRLSPALPSLSVPVRT